MWPFLFLPGCSHFNARTFLSACTCSAKLSSQHCCPSAPSLHPGLCAAQADYDWMKKCKQECFFFFPLYQNDNGYSHTFLHRWHGAKAKCGDRSGHIHCVNECDCDDTNSSNLSGVYSFSSLLSGFLRVPVMRFNTGTASSLRHSISGSSSFFSHVYVPVISQPEQHGQLASPLPADRFTMRANMT